MPTRMATTLTRMLRALGLSRPDPVVETSPYRGKVTCRMVDGEPVLAFQYEEDRREFLSRCEYGPDSTGPLGEFREHGADPWLLTWIPEPESREDRDARVIGNATARALLRR